MACNNSCILLQLKRKTGYLRSKMFWRICRKQVGVYSDVGASYGTEASFYTNLNGRTPTTSSYRDTVTATNATAKILQIPNTDGTIDCLMVGDKERDTNISVFITSQSEGKKST